MRASALRTWWPAVPTLLSMILALTTSINPWILGACAGGTICAGYVISWWIKHAKGRNDPRRFLSFRRSIGLGRKATRPRPPHDDPGASSSPQRREQQADHSPRLIEDHIVRHQCPKALGTNAPTERRLVGQCLTRAVRPDGRGTTRSARSTPSDGRDTPGARPAIPS